MSEEAEIIFVASMEHIGIDNYSANRRWYIRAYTGNYKNETIYKRRFNSKKARDLFLKKIQERMK